MTDIPTTPGQTAEEIDTAQKEERRALLEEAGKLGLTIPKRASVEAIREHIVRHVEAKAQADAILKAQAAEQAAAAPTDMVRCRVLKMGDQKLSKGIHIPGRGDLRYAWKEELSIERGAARAYQERGFVEIIDEAA